MLWESYCTYITNLHAEHRTFTKAIATLPDHSSTCALQKNITMPYFNSPVDNAVLHYIDYRPSTTPAPPSTPSADASHKSSNVTLVFIHGWPMSCAMYEHLTIPLSQSHGIRCVASDRRGFGRSEWTGDKLKRGEEITYDTFAKDTVALLEHLKFEADAEFVFVAASMGCGETLLAYSMMSAQLKEKCKGFIWLGPSMPLPLKTEAHPEGPPRELWDMILTGFRNDRVGFARASLPGVFGIGEQFGEDMDIEVSGTVLERFEGIVAQADALAVETCVAIITSRNLTEELKALDERLKVLVLHGERDQGEFLPSSARSLSLSL